MAASQVRALLKLPSSHRVNAAVRSGKFVRKALYGVESTPAPERQLAELRSAFLNVLRKGCHLQAHAPLVFAVQALRGPKLDP
eukprot:1779029-Lingulodinium_polyedra.AAC.1